MAGRWEGVETTNKGWQPREGEENTMQLGEGPSRVAGVWVLEWGADAGGGQAELVEGKAWVLGSGRRASIVVADRAVSAAHCEVSCVAGQLRVSDLGSRNGLWVSGGRVGEVRFGAGGAFVVGRTVVSCRFVHRSAIEASEDVEPLRGLVGQSSAMRRLAREVRAIAKLKLPVLIRGETGTGKELVARELHALGARRGGPFVALNMGAMPEELADAELFGHERGAFTGAWGVRKGAFEQADGGSLFLDEVAETPGGLQPKLLRALESGEVRRIGGVTTKVVSARVLSASWASLEGMVRLGTFREDLLHRLAVLTVAVPPLRERRSDIGLLARHLLTRLEPELGEVSISSSALSRLSLGPYPGNVRELRNVIYRAAVIAGGHITAEHVAVGMTGASDGSTKRGRQNEAREALLAVGGNVSAAAKALGVARSTVRSWAK